MHTRSPQTYKYHITVGAPMAYDMVYDFDYNYLIDNAGKPLLHFAKTGGSPKRNWGKGNQATLLSEVNPLPFGIRVRWFSVAENQFWEGYHQFGPNMLDKLSRYRVLHLFTRKTTPFMNYFFFTVNVTLGGIVTVWVTGVGEQYILAQFQADKIEEDDWERFSYVLGRKGGITRKAYLKERFSDPDSLMSTQTKKEIENGTLPVDAAPWKRLMRTYPWKLEGDKNFIIKDYWTWFTNGEQYFTYENDKQGFIEAGTDKAVPYFISFYMQGTDSEKTLHRINITFDKEVMMDAFENIAKLELQDEEIKLQVEVAPDLKKVAAYLIKGEVKREVEFTKAALQDLYRAGY